MNDAPQKFDLMTLNQLHSVKNRVLNVPQGVFLKLWLTLLVVFSSSICVFFCFIRSWWVGKTSYSPRCIGAWVPHFIPFFKLPQTSTRLFPCFLRLGLHITILYTQNTHMHSPAYTLIPLIATLQWFYTLLNTFVSFSVKLVPLFLSWLKSHFMTKYMHVAYTMDWQLLNSCELNYVLFIYYTFVTWTLCVKIKIEYYSV